jgi:hypothetical protein
MSICFKTRKRYHASSNTSDSRVNKNTLNHRTPLRDQIEPSKDSFGNPIRTEDPNRFFNNFRYSKVTFKPRMDQIMRDHLDWHANAPDAKMVYMPKLLISKIVNLLTEQQISRIARDVSQEFKDICLMLRGEFTMFSFLDVIVTWLRINETPNRQFQNPEDFRLLIKHDMGYNYSLLVKEIFRYVVSDFYHIEMESIVTENTLGIRIIIPNGLYQN